ncbi:fibrobacter succinogenes major paralogous domain-containing protein [Fibrobacter sp. UWB11]|uniref:fibrobacter succinogenes major paralogous domain-containing protein n=1 Tax=Fibrobacter sp. UWB11 TaxID=1896202 RepID=UPI00092CBB2C|nr:fibrobacter succinogenes major paralogous domain-containing protein [Fibrobacter sp. UWB11]SIO12008.1 major paralogous domain-containing protein [Fibrobacter sp. UWB11]
MKLLIPTLLALFLIACDNDSSTSANNSNDDEKSSKSSSSVKMTSSSSVVILGSTENLTDSRDGQTYKTVTIGTQTWMAQNLNYKAANSFCYESSAENCEKYGRLYLWSAAMDSVGAWSTNGKDCGDLTSCSPTDPVRGVCPKGWHLPSNTEWETMLIAVGGVSTAGKVLKSTSSWNGNGTDDFGFSALSAGYRFVRGDYDLEGSKTYFWSSTEKDNNRAISMSLNGNDDNAFLNGNYKFLGFSVRCLKD